MDSVLYAGPFPDLEELLVREMARDRRDPLQPTVILVGSHALAWQLRRALAGSVGHLNVHLLTFLELAAALTGEVMAAAAPGGILSLDAALVRGGWRYADYGRAVQHSLLDWRAAGGGPTLAEVGPSQTVLARVLAELSANGANRADERAFLERAVSEAAGFPQRFGTNRLILYGFYDFNWAEQRLIEELQHHLRITIYSPVRRRAAAAYGRPFWLWARRQGFTAVRAPQTTWPLRGLSDALFNAGPAVVPTGAVSVLGAPDPEREVAGLAAAAAAAARAGVAWSEIGILLRQGDGYQELLREIFGRQGIPLQMIGPAPLSAGARALLALLTLEGGRSEEIWDWLAVAPWSATSLPPSERAAWEGRLRGGPAFPTAEALTRLGGANASRDRLALVLGWVGEMLAERPEVGAVSDFLAWVDRVVPFWAPDFGPEWERAAAKLRGADPGGLLSREGFQAAVAEALGRTVSLGQPDGIRILGLMPARGLRFRVLLLPGLGEGLFPVPPSPDSILDDGWRARQNRHLPKRLPRRRDRYREEQLLFLLAAESAGEQLILSFAGGRPSPFLLATVEALTGTALDPARLVEWPEYRSVTGPPPVAPLTRAAEVTAARAQLAWEERRSQRFGGFEGFLGDPAIRGRLPGLRRTSASRLECLGSCPARYLLQYVLGLDQEPAGLVNPKERGALAHRLLERLYRRTDPAFPEAVLAELWPEVLSEGAAAGWLRFPENWEAERERLISELALARRLLRTSETGWEVWHLEQPFGGGEAERFFLELPELGRLEVGGVLDRVDRQGERYRVIDYKTGKLPRTEAWRKGTGLQLPLYLLVAADLFRPVSGASLAGRYQSVGPAGGYGSVELSGAEALEWSPEILVVVETLLGQLVRGELFPWPSGDCERCPVRAACPPESRDFAVRKERDSRWQGYRRLKEGRADGR